MVPDIEIRGLSVYFDTAQGPVKAVDDLSTTFRSGRISGGYSFKEGESL